ncbi:rCG40483, isoform CRA_c [Rattus norvegicus]|uniref:RCG40483, isoform CRA_c n=1 Tax=Rattus norvegicus TaxID=10116 RepID=A6I8U5_RAT|nr:rCG40483, isoform CRA_c [Rattus norvegicus]
MLMIQTRYLGEPPKGRELCQLMILEVSVCDQWVPLLLSLC